MADKSKYSRTKRINFGLGKLNMIIICDMELTAPTSQDCIT